MSSASNATVFWHVELVHPDPDAAAALLVEVFGAEPVEQRIASYIESTAPGSRIVHVRLGGVVLQIVRPGDGAESWSRQLEEHGPSIHNVSLMVDDLEGVRDALVERGAKELARFDVQLQDAGLPVAGKQRAYLLDALTQLGLRIEMMQTVPGWTPGEKD